MKQRNPDFRLLGSGEIYGKSRQYQGSVGSTTAVRHVTNLPVRLHLSLLDYHGVCDLVLLDAPDLPYGALKIHIRTTRTADWSFIDAAAISLNGDVMEIGGWGSVIFNGVYTNDKQGQGELPDTFGGYPFVGVQSNKITHEFRI